MKKIKSLILLFVLMFTLAFGFVACKSDESDSSNSNENDPKITLNQTGIALDVYDTFQLIATKENITDEIVWATANQAVATVENGLVKAVAEGTTTITASADEVSAVCTVTVTNSYTAPELDIEKNISVGKDSSYTMDVVTLWKGEPISESVTYSWTLAEGEDANIATIATENNGATVTFSGLDYGATKYVVNAIVRGVPLVAEITVRVVDLDITFDINNLDYVQGAFTANLGLLEIDEHKTSIRPEILVYEDGRLVETPNISVQSDNASIAKMESGVISALSEGTTNIVLSYKNGAATISVTVYRPEIQLNEKVLVQTAQNLTNNYLKIQSSLQGIVASVEVNGKNVMSSYSQENGILLNGAQLPQKASDLGENKEIIIHTDKAKYFLQADMYTLYITDASDIDLMKAAAYSADERLNYWGGYFVLGNDITYNKVFTPVNSIAEIETIYAQNGLVKEQGANTNWDARYNGFCGILDGRGYNIDGMEMASGSGGMFPIFNGTVRNVSFTNVVLGGSTGLICKQASGTIENVYVQVKSVAADGSVRGGTLLGDDAYAYARVKNCFVDMPENNNGAYGIGSVHDGYGILNEVYVVGTTKGVYVLSTGASKKNVCGAYANYNGIIQDGIDFSGWDSSFWQVVNGVPYPQNLEIPQTVAEFTVASTNTGYNVTFDTQSGKYTVLSLNQQAIDMGITLNGGTVVIPNDSTLSGKNFQIIAKPVFGNGASIVKTITILQTQIIEVETRSTIDLAKIGNTITLNVGSSLNAVNGQLVNASINNKTFGTFAVNGSSLTLSADALNGTWGNANITLTYERRQGEQVVQAINVKVPVYIYRTINNAEELLALESYVTVDGLNAYGIFELTADIDLNGATFNGVGTWNQEWTHQFHGTFDGKGHTISNYIAGALNRGFMSCIARDGVVKNIIFENVTLPGMSGFVCTKNDGLVENVFVYAKTLEAGENWIPASAIVSKNNGTIRNVVVVLKDHNLYENGFGGGIAGWSNGTVENAILINLDSDTLYAIGVNGTSVSEQGNTDSETVKSFQGFEAYAAWIKADGAESSWASWHKQMISDFVGTMIQPVATQQSVGTGETVTLTVADSTYVASWSVNNSSCTIENGELNIGTNVAFGTIIKVTVTGLDGTKRSIDVCVATIKAVDLGNLGDLEVAATEQTYSITLGTDFNNISVNEVLVDGTALSSDAWTVSSGELIIARTYLAAFYGERTLSIIAEKENNGVVSESVTATAKVCIISKIIRTLDDLNNMKNYAYGKESVSWSLWGTTYTEDAWTGYYVLGGNITLSNTDSIATKLNAESRLWDDALKLAGFYGTLDGRGYAIVGGTYNLGGILGHGSKNAVVKNIAFKGVSLGTNKWSSVIAVSYWGALENVLIEITADNRTGTEGGAVIVQTGNTLNAKNIIVYDKGGRTTANAGTFTSYVNHKGNGWGTHENVYVFTDYYVVHPSKTAAGYYDGWTVEAIAKDTSLTAANVDTSKFDSTIWNLTGTEAKFVKETTV